MSDVDVQPETTHLDTVDAHIAESDGRKDKPYRQWVRWAIIGDVVAAAAAATTARALRFGIDAENDLVSSTSGTRVTYMAIGLIVPVVWPVVSALCGGYDLRTLFVGVEELRRVLRSGVSLLALLGFVFFASDLLLSRGYVAALVPLTVAFTGIWRMLLRRRVRLRHRIGIGHHNVVAVGPVDELQRLCVQLLSRPGSGIDVVAYVADDDDGEPMSTGPLSLIRRLPNRDAIHALQEQGIPVDLLVRAGRPHHDEMWVLARRANDLGAALAVAPHREDASANVAVSYVPLGHTPLLVVETPTLRPSARAIKAVFDRVMALLMVVAFTPVFLGLSLAILITEGRPIFYRQERVGRHGQLFRCLKFRTMHADADARLADLMHLNEADPNGPLFKIKDDPRVTRIGRWLRAHSLDELPQLFNVLGGSMSIVGPRPPVPHEVATYNEREARRLLVKPGMTGLWQVEGRSDLPWDDGVYLDLLYVDHWSPLLDLVIIARTARVPFQTKGAY